MSVINLLERTDRWESFQKVWDTTRLAYHRTDAFKEEDVYKAVFLKHRFLIEEAHLRGDKYLLVLEDDAVPSPDFDARWSNIKSALHSFEAWDVFNGGCLAIHDKIDRIFCVKDNETGLTTALLDVSRGCMAQFLYFNVANMLPKMRLWEEKGCPHFDSWYCGEDFKTLACIPYLATQSDGYSNAQSGHREWEERFKAEESSLRYSLREFFE